MTVMADIGSGLRVRMENASMAHFHVRKIAGVWHMRYSDERGAATASGLTPQQAATKLADRLGL